MIASLAAPSLAFPRSLKRHAYASASLRVAVDDVKAALSRDRGSGSCLRMAPNGRPFPGPAFVVGDGDRGLCVLGVSL